MGHEIITHNHDSAKLVVLAPIVLTLFKKTIDGIWMRNIKLDNNTDNIIMKTDSLKDEGLQRTASNGNGEVENASPEDAGLQRGLAGRHLVS